MHSSVASSSFGLLSSEQLDQRLLHQHYSRVAAVSHAAALPSLAGDRPSSVRGIRTQTPPPYAELAQSSSSHQSQAFGAASGRSSSLSSASSNSMLNASHSSGANGFWKNPILYKTTMCDNWTAKKPCKYGVRCWYAHGYGEMRYVPRLDQLPENVREALFVEPALARAFFQEMTAGAASATQQQHERLDSGYPSSSSTSYPSSASSAVECDSRSSLTSSSGCDSRSSLTSGSVRLSMSPASIYSDAISSPSSVEELDGSLFAPAPAPAAVSGTTSYLADRRAKRWAPGAAWSDGGDTPRASRVPAALIVPPKETAAAAPTASQEMPTYRLFDDAHPLAINLSFLGE